MTSSTTINTTEINTTEINTTQTSTTRIPAVLWYAAHTARLTIKNWPYLIFTLAMPVIMYLVFTGLWGTDQVVPGVSYATVIMVQMAAYGALGAAMSGGAVIALERRSGWFRQLTITALAPRSFLIARTATVLTLVLPALALVFAFGYAVGGVRAPISAWVVSALLMWLALVPLAALGLVIGIWVKGEAAQGATTLIMLLLSLAGGLWFPAEMMPATMQSLAQTLPSYWIAYLGRWPFVGGSFPGTGLVVLAVWTVALVLLGGLGYRRAAAHSKR